MCPFCKGFSLRGLVQLGCRPDFEHELINFGIRDSCSSLQAHYCRCAVLVQLQLESTYQKWLGMLINWEVVRVGLIRKG